MLIMTIAEWLSKLFSLFVRGCSIYIIAATLWQYNFTTKILYAVKKIGSRSTRNIIWFNLPCVSKSLRTRIYFYWSITEINYRWCYKIRTKWIAENNFVNFGKSFVKRNHWIKTHDISLRKPWNYFRISRFTVLSLCASVCNINILVNWRLSWWWLCKLTNSVFKFIVHKSSNWNVSSHLHWMIVNLEAILLLSWIGALDKFILCSLLVIAFRVDVGICYEIWCVLDIDFLFANTHSVGRA